MTGRKGIISPQHVNYLGSVQDGFCSSQYCSTRSMHIVIHVILKDLRLLVIVCKSCRYHAFQFDSQSGEYTVSLYSEFPDSALHKNGNSGQTFLYFSCQSLCCMLSSASAFSGAGCIQKEVRLDSGHRYQPQINHVLKKRPSDRRGNDKRK